MFSTTKKTQLHVLATLIALVGILTPTNAFAMNGRSVTASPSPKATPVIHQILKASQAHPQLAIPGDTIDVTLKTGVTRVQVLGPTIPQVSADALPGTFKFSFKGMSGKTLIDIHDFGILDGEDTLIRPVRFDDGSTSFMVKAGQTKTVKITSFMAVGTGTLRWAPLNHYVVDWQFVEETA